MQTNLKPKNGNVILHWVKEEEYTTDFGIIVADSGRKRGEFATVVAVCPESDLEVGQTVAFNKLSGQFVTDDNLNEFLIIKETEIYGIIEE